MKLIFAIVSKNDTNNVVQALVKEKYYVTRLATTGGFLKQGNTTLLMGVENEQVEDVLNILKNNTKERKEVTDTPYEGASQIRVGGATVFVIKTEKFKKV
ncbi:MAG: cyclic-di-AMP receptor [Bacilli bacterium]|nr:cyclic-di-AMP receptor [Bacilli bacterium]